MCVCMCTLLHYILLYNKHTATTPSHIMYSSTLYHQEHIGNIIVELNYYYFVIVIERRLFIGIARMDLAM